MITKITAVAVFCLIFTTQLALAQYDNNIDRLEKLARAAAERAANSALDDSEIKTISYRRELMSRPGLQFYVIFFNDMGQPMDYFVTSGKCSSANKRLTQSWKFVDGQTGKDSDGNSVYGDFDVPTASEDGTFGKSDEYVYCKTVDGKYKQWNGRYYISDAPIELTIKSFVVDLSGKNQQQQ